MSLESVSRASCNKSPPSFGRPKRHRSQRPERHANKILGFIGELIRGPKISLSLQIRYLIAQNRVSANQSVRYSILPATYEAARNALAQCQAIDECKDWADKAAALASYARQSEDLELEKMAARIRARAMRRAGEIAKQMMQPHGGDRKSNQVTTDRNLMPREKVQEVSGFSKHQLDTSLRVASI